ncbi:unnamed protein product [Ambrosiozyma monospora]|uniref:Unnamed protein product n=1 Tax=Ambrosiozyma monospora TaxID=43982 RepID=A0ACB5T9W3_AMBMO|nr:unnamed protein product [Ambrosiozyma monospora]
MCDHQPIAVQITQLTLSSINLKQQTWHINSFHDDNCRIEPSRQRQLRTFIDHNVLTFTNQRSRLTNEKFKLLAKYLYQHQAKDIPEVDQKIRLAVDSQRT